MQWLELTVHTTTAAIDLLAAELTVLGYDSFIIDDQADFHKFWRRTASIGTMSMRNWRSGCGAFPRFASIWRRMPG